MSFNGRHFSSEDVHMDEIPEIDTPQNLRPDLTTYGIIEYDRGICADTVENRKILRSHKISWLPIFNAEGQPDQNLIQAISPEMNAASTMGALVDRAPIMKDPTDKNSDYLTGIHLILQAEAPELVPSWVLAACKTWHGYTLDPSTKQDSKLIGPPQRCQYIKSDGVRCLLWAAGRRDNDGYCRTHMRTVAKEGPGMALIRARNRIQQAATAAVDTLEHLMDTAESEPVRLKSATELLDRAGIRGGVELDVHATMVTPAADVIRKRLERFQQNAVEMAEIEAVQIEDAEVVEDEPEVKVMPYRGKPAEENND